MTFNVEQLQETVGKAAQHIYNPERELPILSEAIEACADLLANHWNRIRDIRESADGIKLTTNISIEVDNSGERAKVRTKISYSEKHSDDRECYVNDPNQTEMKFKGDDIEVKESDESPQEPLAIEDKEVETSEQPALEDGAENSTTE
jgi:hypothetical protein